MTAEHRFGVVLPHDGWTLVLRGEAADNIADARRWAARYTGAKIVRLVPVESDASAPTPTSACPMAGAPCAVHGYVHGKAALDAVAREGWRACVLLAAARVSQEADRTYAEADEACGQKAKSALIEELHESAGAGGRWARWARRWLARRRSCGGRWARR